jgi:hypothetical protein
MMDVIWSYDNNGRLAIYRRDEGEKDFTKVLELNNIPTLQYRFGAPKNEGQHTGKPASIAPPQKASLVSYG